MNTMFLTFRNIIILTGLLFSTHSLALTFPLPGSEDAVIGRVKTTMVGEVQTTVVSATEDITDLGRKYDVGYLEFQEANPGVDLDDLYRGEELRVPTRFILPDVPRVGIVINVAELRLYYYPPHSNMVVTFPVGIGRENAVTPLVKTKIVEKRKDPVWYPTALTRAEAEEKGIALPAFIEAGPDNPLGDYAMRMGVSTYLIHGTNDPSGVGIRSSGGCIRMYPEDVKELFSMVSIGTPVHIINQTDKVGWDGRYLMLESHVPLNHKQGRSERELNEIIPVLKPYIKKYHAEIYWEKALTVAGSQLGIPERIGIRQSL